jgi:dolichyl-phosphate beta-glucosyltransferase
MNPSLSVIIPAFNEEHRIRRTLLSIRDFLEDLHLEYEIIVVDDGSSDGTKKVVENLTKEISRVRIIHSLLNEGKGSAVKKGMLSAQGRHRLFMDADGSTDIREYKKLAPFLDNGFDVVVGSRHVLGAHIQTQQSAFREILGGVFRGGVHMLIPLTVKDTQNGFKLFSARAADDIFSRTQVTGWMFDVEVLYLAQQRGYRIKEVPIVWVNDAESRMRPSHMFTMLFDATRLLLRKKTGEKD